MRRQTDVAGSSAFHFPPARHRPRRAHAPGDSGPRATRSPRIIQGAVVRAERAWSRPEAIHREAISTPASLLAPTSTQGEQRRLHDPAGGETVWASGILGSIFSRSTSLNSVFLTPEVLNQPLLPAAQSSITVNQNAQMYAMVAFRRMGGASGTPLPPPTWAIPTSSPATISLVMSRTSLFPISATSNWSPRGYPINARPDRERERFLPIPCLQLKFLGQAPTARDTFVQQVASLFPLSFPKLCSLRMLVSSKFSFPAHLISQKQEL